MPKISLSKDELMNNLKEQINLLKSSFDSYFRGVKAEAKRMAVIIRVLLHDTSQSKSLLGLLKLKNINFLDTSTDFFKISPEAIQISVMKTGLAIFRSDGQFVPKCEAFKDPEKFVSFDDWWEKAVIIDSHNNKFTRKDLVLYLANKEGGAHVEDKLDESYYELTRENSKSLGYLLKINGETKSMENIELASVCEIAYEVLESIKKSNCC